MTVHFINENLIDTGDRQRKKFATRPLDELVASIFSPMGLINPITVRQDATHPDRFKIVAGERRLRAIRQIYEDKRTFAFAGLYVEKGMIPVIIASESLSDTDIFEAELAENLRREDLTWSERVTAISELHAFRQSQNPAQTYRDTANELAPKPDADPDEIPNPEVSSTKGASIANAMLISAHLDDPDVAAAVSERDALRIVTRKLEREFARATPKLESPHSLYHADFRALDLTDIKFDVVITDPPYGIGVAKFGDAAKLRHEYSEDNIQALHQQMVKTITRRCAENAHAYVFCDPDFFFFLRRMFFAEGWSVRRTPLIWSKGNQGHLPDGDVYGYRRSFECILLAWRGTRSHKALHNDVIHIEPDRDRVHAAQKPIHLYIELMRMSAYSGDKVFDPFAGSGPIFAAAIELGCVATGCEINEKFVEYIEATYQIRRK